MRCSTVRRFGGLVMAVALGLTLAAPVSSQKPMPDEEVFPLAAVFGPPGEAGGLMSVQDLARDQAKPGKQPMYKSGMVETKVFEGCFIPDEAFPAKAQVTVAVSSDDGVNVFVDGKQIHKRFKMGQHLPFVTEKDIPANEREKRKGDVSFHVLNGSDGKGAPWKAGQPYHIRIE
jgi:hypothetical protein